MTIRFSKPMMLITACAALTAIPAATNAAEPSAMDTCIQTFVSEQLPQGRKIEVVKREMSPLYWGSARPAQIKVTARSKRTGREITSATCLLDRHGGLVAMHVQGERIRLARGDEPKARTPGG